MDDHILYWNDVALTANQRDFSNVPGTQKPDPAQGGPTLSSRALAIVHLAMYDAHAGAVGGADLPRYLSSPPSPPPGTSAAAAVALAAHTCLRRLFPRQAAHFDRALADAGLAGPGTNEGVEFGRKVGQCMLSVRGDDPSASADGYVFSAARGRHRPDPANPHQGVHAPFYGRKSKLFAATQRHSLDKPPTLGSAEYV